MAMMMSPMVSKTALNNLRIAGTCLHSLALVATGFRAAHRWRRGKFFWDDIWALVAASLNSILLITLWVRAHTRTRAALGHPLTVLQGRILHMVMSLTFICVIWAARVSIACSILRLLPPCRTKKFVLGMIGWFAITFAVLFIQRIWWCGSNKAWADDCPCWTPFIIEKLCTDVIANVMLVVVPVLMLWNSTLPKGPCWMIRVVFATSITVTACSATHAVYVLGDNRILEGFTAHFEAAVTVMICNLLVIVTFCYRALRNGHDLDEELSEYMSSRTERRAPLTAVSFTEISTQSPGSSFLSYERGTSVFRDQSSTGSHLTVPGLPSPSKQQFPSSSS